jgi:hypothetical protein
MLDIASVNHSFIVLLQTILYLLHRKIDKKEISSDLQEEKAAQAACSSG